MTTPAFYIRNDQQTSSPSPTFFKIGVPCVRGQWWSTDTIGLLTPFGLIEHYIIEARSLWQDGSIKWLWVEGFATLDEGIDIPVSLSVIPAAPTQISSPLTESSTTLKVKTSEGEAEFDKTHFFSIRLHDTNLAPSLCINNEELSFEVIECHYELVSCTRGASAVKFSQSATIGGAFCHQLTIQSDLTLWLHNGALRGTITITNTNPATHPGGQWDLGDDNSIEIDAFNLCGESNATISVELSDESQSRTLQDEHIEVFQASSGKPHWNSPNHVDKLGKVTTLFKGYSVAINGITTEHEGQCQPSIVIAHDRKTWCLEISEFWQNHPSCLRVNKRDFSLSLLGTQSAAAIELQPGEQKTRSLELLPADVTVAKSFLGVHYTAQTQCIPFFDESQKREGLHELIQKGLDEKCGFKAKRDQIDEYGWRHFGELYADHEKAQDPDTEYFVSHYNNQYDPIAGMLYQWVLTQNTEWLTLSDSLAKHVADIDVYHTSKDKPEYAGGLFWHTDHYVQACTATHRTYSKNQPSNIYEGHAGGGGPGGQHCYTTGLLLHYYLTGSITSKRALLSICDWIEHYYESDGTVFGWLLGIKNSGAEGLKNFKTGAYPLDRGTGNYLQALMDKYELTSCQSNIDKCAHIIFNTVSPLDSFVDRQLDNVEATWFYTVFLQATCRFIAIKERLLQNDGAYAHAVKSLLHYARWMARNEYPYLDKPDILEFPNETWTGQDLRKVCVLNFAAQYEEKNKCGLMTDKAQELLAAINARLNATGEATTTRVLCLMMQNYSYLGYQSTPKPMALDSNYHIESYMVRSTVKSGLMQVISNFSFTRERQQLTKRFPQLQFILGRPGR